MLLNVTPTTLLHPVFHNLEQFDFLPYSPSYFSPPAGTKQFARDHEDHVIILGTR